MIDLSASTYSILWQNILIALGIKLVFFALALFGSATMWMAVFADTGASLLASAKRPARFAQIGMAFSRTG